MVLLMYVRIEINLQLLFAAILVRVFIERKTRRLRACGRCVYRLAIDKGVIARESLSVSLYSIIDGAVLDTEKYFRIAGDSSVGK